MRRDMDEENDNAADPGNPKLPAGRSPAYALAMAALALCILGAMAYLLARGGQDGMSVEKTYDIGEMLKTDDSLVAFTEIKPIPTGFSRAACIAMGPDNMIYAGGDRRIRIFKKDGARTGEIELDQQPACIAVSGNGEIFAGLADSVLILDKTGEETRRWSFGPKSIVSGISLSENRVFIADTGRRALLVKDLESPDSEPVEIGVPGAGDGDDGFVVYSSTLDVAADENDLLFVTDPGRHRLKLYSFSGGLVSTWPSNPSADVKGFSGCCNPARIALYPQGRIVTSEKAIPRIKLYSAAGDFVAVVAGPESFVQGQAPCDVAADSDGRIYALDPATGNIRIFIEKPGKE